MTSQAFQHMIDSHGLRRIKHVILDMDRNTEIIALLKGLFLEDSCIISRFDLNYNTNEVTSNGISTCVAAEGEDLKVLMNAAEENLAMMSVNLHSV